VWAVVWATIGFGAVWAAVSLFATSPWVLAGAVLLVVVVIGWLVRRRLLRRAQRDGSAGVQAEV
jgi:membrane protein implicated in regulation of membrane protease activity